ncbi:N-acyl homoserine lactonase family protein [uncultured Fructobacillus sp.]|uniref:N-acyl homoserine lactonase family protein n=1 Tax=uncultured Fructobacillus sp. TaxID=591942 RepID=UPI002597DB86|nr:N-acyl homoserine lactonase family protein [uncultured Fructobacillus sp.]
MIDKSKIKIHILRTGLVKLDKALPFHGQARNPLAFTGVFRSEVNQLILPVSSYLIEHPKGLVLIDTGWHTNIRQGNWQELGLQTKINKGYLPANWAVNEQVNRFGYSTSDIDLVLMSHLHSDHASGLKLVKDAKKIMVSSEEWNVANKLPLVYLPGEWQNINIDTYEYNRQGIGAFNRYYDVFGDGSLLQLYTPGHTSGMSATLVRGIDNKYIILAADTGYTKESWQHMITPGVCTSRSKAITSLGWLANLSHDSNCLDIIINHDPDEFERMIELAY